jgi:hypothetical protein
VTSCFMELGVSLLLKEGKEIKYSELNGRLHFLSALCS